MRESLIRTGKSLSPLGTQVQQTTKDSFLAPKGSERPALAVGDRRGRTLSHSRKSGKVYLVRNLRKENENTLIGQVVELQLPDDFCLFEDAGLWCAVPLCGH